MNMMQEAVIAARLVLSGEREPDHIVNTQKEIEALKERKFPWACCSYDGEGMKYKEGFAGFNAEGVMETWGRL
jgi:hypothetical protein